ncbi:hypothetical protein ABMA70_09120 [Halobacteriovorax sp. XZX-3]|uniref:hypothetical protein n=1 Tax=unclassified Halobacteriovorax TaxID=2639665 RepID=UPI000CD28F05|nr:hypothetical protein [Halobacteriovorax sp. DA5]POB13244.1 hypothetical protein C0Z22_12075 [Halobacteriovorax sp. DA5]
MQKTQDKELEKNILNQAGQTFVEFIFLLVILIGLSVSLLKGSNSFLAKQWEIAVNSIVRNYPGHNPGVKLTE